jgi:hypothetical protein
MEDSFFALIYPQGLILNDRENNPSPSPLIVKKILNKTSELGDLKHT